MQTPFKSIGIIGKPSDPSIAETLSRLYDYLTHAGYRVLIAADSVAFIKGDEVPSSLQEDLGRQCDLVIAVGGDGTFLAAARAIV
ncbi:MAG TPA: NAD(+)/NADH kinase, partial [Methylomicrobium sp.]|nr:NAD(+)/NADH kinase [Methylomicrobium sp.]